MLSSSSIFVKTLNSPANQSFCVMLSRLCETYGIAPHQYLLNDLDDCAHTRLCIDMAVFSVYSEWKFKLDEANARRLRAKGR